MAPPAAQTADRWLAAALVLLCGSLLFVGLGRRALWDVDEGMHAATARDMVLTGDWITPCVNGVPFFDKPPLFNWLTALSFMAFGFTEFAARLPAALLGAGTVLVTCLLGRRMYGQKTALIGGIILVTFVEFLILSRVVVHDICLTLFVTLALFLFWIGYDDERRRRTCFLVAWLAIGFAVMAKGPVGLVLPGLIVLVFLAVRRELGLVKESRILLGLPLAAVIAAPWYIAVSMRDDSFATHFLGRQNLGYFFSSESRHAQPFWYYIPVLLGGMLPWSGFLPMAFLHAIRRRGQHLTPSTVFLLTWFIVTLTFFSLAQSKLSPYVLVLFPAGALLIATVWRDLFEGTEPTLRRGFILSAMPLVLVSVGIAVILNTATRDTLPRVGGLDLPAAGGVAIVVASVACAGFGLLIARRDRAYFASIPIVMLVFLFGFLIMLAPGVDAFRSTKTIAGTIDAALAPGEPIVCYRSMKDSALFYTDRKIREIHGREFRRFLRNSPDRVLCILDMRYLELEDVARLRDDYHIIETHGNKQIISNRPGPLEPSASAGAQPLTSRAW